jgi:hypothetical protein
MTTQSGNSDSPSPVPTTPVKTPHDLSRAALVEIAATIQGRMYLDLGDDGCEFWNPGKQWSCADVCMDMQEILSGYGLVPGEDQPYEGSSI